MTPGQVMVKDAYAQGKMLDHSGWNGMFPRGITPSDIDAVLADGTHMMLMEFSSQHEHWPDVSRGQRRLYADLVLKDPSKTVAVLARHKVPSIGSMARMIDTRRDIIAFEVLFAIQTTLFVEPCLGNDRWQKFIDCWMNKRDEFWQWLRKGRKSQCPMN